jgi:hypothetical protein
MGFGFGAFATAQAAASDLSEHYFAVAAGAIK